MSLARKLTLAGLPLIAACGGGGEQLAGIDGRGAPAPVASSVVTRGTITGFGSVIVNGVRYDTSSAVFTIDGEAGTESDLAVGDVVVIEATIDGSGNAFADTVVFDDAVEGPISALDLAADTLTVLGQLVRIDGATSFDDDIMPRSLEGLAVNEVVEVSGFVLADGSITATRIERKVPGGELELTGIVSNAGATTFEVNGFVVDFSAAVLTGFPNGTPEDGQRVEAKGDELGPNDELLATEVELEDGGLFDGGDQAEVEGFITLFNSAADFEVEGIRVRTTAQTEFENGSSADLALNRKVEVEGEIDADGVLVAERIEFKPTGELLIESLVDDVQSSSLTVLGVRIAVNSATRYEDESDVGLTVFGLDDISAGDFVSIRAFDDQGTITATVLERDNFPGVASVKGIAGNLAAPNFEILGVAIATDVDTEFTDENDIPLTPAEFFAEADGRTVEASGEPNGSIIEAEEVELDD